MENKKHIVIFSHGFGVRKDDLGLLSGPNGIAESMPEVESVLFDYFEVDDIKHILKIRPFSQQVAILRQKVKETQELNPGAIIDIIAHSRGTNIVALAKPDGVRKVLLLSTPFDMGIERTLKRYTSRTDCVINLDGDSTLYELGGYIRIVPKEFWAERKTVDVIKECNELGEKTEVIVIEANQDTLVPKMDLKDLSGKIKVINLDGDHNFNGDAREGLIKTIREIILA